MWTSIAMWGGVAGLIVSIFAVIILFLTRKNILDILDKDVILFSRNFELKKTAIENSFKIADEILQKGGQIILNNEFNERAKKVYNELLCVVSDVNVADEFYSLAIENNAPISEARIFEYKLHCRKDIGLTVKKSNIKRQNSKQADNFNNYNTSNAPKVQYVNNANSNTATNVQTPAVQPKINNQPQPNAQNHNPSVSPKVVNPIVNNQTKNTTQNLATNSQTINRPTGINTFNTTSQTKPSAPPKK